MVERRLSGASSTVTLPVSSFSPTPEGLLRQVLDPPHHPLWLGALDHYEVLALLGAGGMGLVLRARDARNGASVAIKMLHPGLAWDPAACQRFLREARHMQRLHHPNILPVLDVAEHPCGPYFVMPCIAEGSLSQRIQPGKPLDDRFILQVARQIASAVACAHRHGIIHHDLKPGNVLLDGRPHPFLTDFGLARTVFNETVAHLEAERRVGTAPYMSPAVAAGEMEDTRCDIYSFGALLYEMLTGSPPYRGETAEEILGKILAGPPPSIGEINPSASTGLVTVAEAAMARAIRDRYASMVDMVADLERVAAGEIPRGR